MCPPKTACRCNIAEILIVPPVSERLCGGQRDDDHPKWMMITVMEVTETNERAAAPQAWLDPGDGCHGRLKDGCHGICEDIARSAVVGRDRRRGSTIPCQYLMPVDRLCWTF